MARLNAGEGGSTSTEEETTTDDGGTDTGDAGLTEKSGGETFTSAEDTTTTDTTTDDGGTTTGDAGLTEKSGGETFTSAEDGGDFDPVVPTTGAGHGLDGVGTAPDESSGDGGAAAAAGGATAATGTAATGSAPAIEDEPLPDAPSQQGIESGPGSVSRRARELEQDQLKQKLDPDDSDSPTLAEMGLDASDVTVVRDGDRIVTRLTERGKAKIRQYQARQVERDYLDDLGLTDENLVRVEADEDTLLASLTLEGEREAAGVAVREQLAERFGPGGWDVGEDFTISRGDDGWQAVLTEKGQSLADYLSQEDTAGPRPEGRMNVVTRERYERYEAQEDTARNVDIPDRAASQLDQSLESRYGTSLERGSDYTLTRTTEDGEVIIESELTAEGRIKTAGVRETGQTFIDRGIESFERRYGIDLIPGEGDVIQPTEAYLRQQAQIHREGRGLLPNAEQAEAMVDYYEPIPGSVVPSREVVQGFAERSGEVINPAGFALGTGKAVEGIGEYGYNTAIAELEPEPDTPEIRFSFTDQTLREATATARERQEASETAAGAAGARLVRDTATGFRERPGRTLGAALFEIGAFAATEGAAIGASRVIGRGARTVRDRYRTAGGKHVPLEDLTQRPVVRYTETGGSEGRPFPAAEDAGLYRTDPADAFSQQAERYTPESVQRYYQRAGIDDTTIVKKAVDVEPEGPGTRGFEATEGAYEAPGAFVGPELSPYFLRTGERSSISLRPGLPSLGGRPTGVLASTKVEQAAGRTLEDFAAELRERAGESVALTKPRGIGSAAEIEAVIPPGGQFTRVASGSRLREAAARFGFGSEFYTKVGGRRIPLRPVRSAADEATDVAGAGRRGGRSLESYYRPLTDDIDRALPLPPPQAGAGARRDRRRDRDEGPRSTYRPLDADRSVIGGLDSERWLDAQNDASYRVLERDIDGSFYGLGRPVDGGGPGDPSRGVPYRPGDDYPAFPGRYTPIPADESGGVPGRRPRASERDKREREWLDEGFTTDPEYYEAPIATAREVAGGALEKEAGLGLSTRRAGNGRDDGLDI